MIQEKEAQELMEKLIQLRADYQQDNTKTNLVKLKKHEELCVNKFYYIVLMATNKYRNFSNYEDLNQEGLEVLLKAMKNYKPKKGSFFWWSHKYVRTRVVRQANLHSTIRYPLKVAKEMTPHKESIMPLMIEERYCPDKELETSQINKSIKDAIAILTQEQQNIINLAYGFTLGKPMSINKICKKLNISRVTCIKTINTSLSFMKDSIKI